MTMFHRKLKILAEKSKTLFFPIGIHLGNNWATRHLITKTNKGDSIFFIPDNVPIDTWKDFIIVIIVFNAFFLFVTYLIWKWDTIIMRMKNYLAIF